MKKIILLVLISGCGSNSVTNPIDCRYKINLTASDTTHYNIKAPTNPFCSKGFTH